MKKSTRKLMALSLAACMALTAAGALAEENTVPRTDGQTSPTAPGGMNGWSQQTPPSMPGGMNGWNQQTPPSMPGGMNGWNQQTPPSTPDGQNDETQQTPPSMPGGMNGWNWQTPPSTSDGQNDETQQTPPSTPDGQDGEAWQTPPSMPGGMNGWNRQQPYGFSGDRQNGGRQKQNADTSGGSDSDAGENSGGSRHSGRPGDGGSHDRQQAPDMNGRSNDGSQGGTRQKPGKSGEAEDEPSAPEFPDAAMPDGAQTPPERPEGAQPGDGQTPPERTDGAQPSDGQTPPELPGGQGGSGAPAEYSAASVVTESSDGASYASEAGDENAVLVSSGEVTLSGATVEKTGSSEGESADFYGINAAVLASGGATLTIQDASVTSDGAHANGVFSYGQGTTVNVSGTAITTSGDNSGGLMITGGATMNATNVTVSTAGRSSAAIRSDRGGGTVTVEGGSYSTAGVGSPAVYSTADITVANAELSASSSEAVVIEGGNSVTLTNVSATGNNAVLNGQSTVSANVLIYQSMSGDAAEGSSSFTMSGGSMTAQTGDMFHVTNVTTEITLSGVEFTSEGGVFLSAGADAWGRSGSNGGHVTLNLADQSVTGDMTVDAVSSLALNLNDGASFTGAINPEGASGSVTVTLSAGASWTLTADSYVTGVSGDLTRVNLNGFTLYVNGEAAT